MRSKLFQLVLVIISSLYPLFGLFFLHWSPFATVLMYWTETLIILLFFQAYVWSATFLNSHSSKKKSHTRSIVPTVLIFCFLHFWFVVEIFGAPIDFSSLGPIRMAPIYIHSFVIIGSGILILFVRYLMPFITFIVDKEYMNVDENWYKENSQQVLKRILLMQVTVIFGGFLLVRTFYNPINAVTGLIILQALFTIVPYVRGMVDKQNINLDGKRLS
jgi:hypothetical protein